MYNPETDLLRKTEATEGKLEKSESEMYDFFMKDKDLREERGRRQLFQDLDEFSDVYPPEMIRASKKFVQERRREKPGDHAVRGQLLETVLSEYTDMAGWFGDAAAYRASEYDDRKHGVDVIFESEGSNGKPVYLAVDCTISENQRTLDEKIDSVIRSIESDTLTTVEFFESERSDHKGELNFVPKVIVAMDPHRMEELATECLPIMKKEKNRYQKLKNSHLQIFFLRQIEAQLKKQFQLVRLPREDMRPHRKEVMEAVKNTLEYIQKTLKEKENSLDQNLIKRGNEEYSQSGLESALVASA